MNVTFKSISASDAKADSGAALIICGADIPTIYGDLSVPSKASGFDGKAGAGFETYVGSVRVFVRGRGSKDDFDFETCVGKVVKALKNSGTTHLSVHLNDLDASPDDAARCAVGARMAGYQFNTRRSKATLPKKSSVERVTIIAEDAEAASASYDNYHGPVTDGMMVARELVNEPPNVIYPEAYAARIAEYRSIGLEVEILGEAKMAALGMHALLGVGLGSERDSQMVIMRWNGGQKDDAPVCLVGKGVTFDTGGISLKPGANMWDMKGDMGGSAAVVGTMIGLAKRKAKANVVGIVGLVENMPDGKAQLPGDIVTSMSGQTIEVQNTDAEGRLVLADALHYAITHIKPAAMINLATLTGAIIIALGEEYAGLFSNDDTLAGQILSASETSKDKTWRLPLHENYDKLLNSEYADMKNIGGRAAGSITAAQFLKRFVGKDTPWAHLDVAGTAMKPTRKNPLEPTFGTGFGVRLLNRWVADNYES